MPEPTARCRQIVPDISYIKNFLLKVCFQNSWRYCFSDLDVVCFLTPSNFNPSLHIGEQCYIRYKTTFAENMSTIDAGVVEILYSEVVLLVSSALHSMAY